MMRRSVIFLALSCAVLLLTASDCRRVPPNMAPTANAGADQTVPVGQVVTLDGSGSTDPDDDTLSFSWRFMTIPAGSQAILSAPDTATPSFTPDLPGTHTAELTVSDGQDRSTDTVTIIATDVKANQPPTADAGADQTVQVGDTVTLGGGGSSDPDGDTLSYAWDMTSRPNGSAATLTQADSAQAGFTPDVAGDYTFTLAVSDGSSSDSDTVTVTATQRTANRTPVADAGQDQTVQVGDAVTLDGSGSNDPDGDALSYDWMFITWPDRSNIPAPALDGADTPTPSFTAGDAGSYTLELTISDGQASASDRVSISAESNTPSTTVHVSPTGSDTNSGRRDAPVRTLARALGLAEELGLTSIFLFDGTYDTEPFDYVIDRPLFIKGESQSGTILAAGDADILTLVRPQQTSEFLTVILQDLTLGTTGMGVDLPFRTELHLTRVTCLNASPCVRAAELFAIFPAPGGTLTVRDSRVVGQGSGTGFIMAGMAHLISDTTITGYERGIFGFGASFQLNGLMLTNNTYGLYLWNTIDIDNDGTEDPVIMRNSTLDGNDTGIYVNSAQLHLTDVTVSNSGKHGIYLDGNLQDNDRRFTDVTVTRSGASGVHLAGGTLEVTRGSFSQNGRDNPGDFVDRAGLYATGNSTLVVRDATVSGNIQDNVVVLESATATLNDITGNGVPGLGAGVYANTSESVVVSGGTFNGNNNGFYISGDTTLTLQNVTAQDNRSSGLSFGSSGNLKVRESKFLDNGRFNIRIRNAPNRVDLGIDMDPGNNWVRLGEDTEWSLSDERPSVADPSSSPVYAFGLWDVKWDGLSAFVGRCYDGPDSYRSNWRITGNNQRICFGAG